MGVIGNKKYQRYYLAIVFAVILVLLPTHPAKACILGWDPISSCILEGTSYFVFLIFTIVGKGIVALAIALQAVINIPIYPDGGIAVIDESWKIMRNFANMFFIVALILMAFATIFDILPGAAKYNARALFGRFLFTALLINFSLVLGVMVIQGTQILSNTFLTSIGDMSSRLGQTLNPSLLLPNPGQTTLTASAVDNATFGAFISLIFALVLAMTFLFSILTALIFTLIRIPILWALLIVSPIAWILNVFPAGEGMFKKWWSTFIGWNMFLPVFLFFLYFGFYFLSNQTAVMAAIAQQSANQSLGEGIPLSLQKLLFYVLAAIFLIGGTMTALKASMFGGAGVVGVAGFARGVAARRLGLTAANQAWQEKKKEIQGGEGRLGKIFGGPPPGLDTARRALGVRGADLGSQQRFVDQVGREYSTLETNYRLGRVNVGEVRRLANSGSATNPKVYAARKMLAKTGQLDAAISQRTFSELRDNPLAMEDFAKTASGARWSSLNGDNMRAIRRGTTYRDPTGVTHDYSSLNSRNGIVVRREAVSHMQNDKLAIIDPSFDVAEFKEYLTLQGGPTTNDSKELIKAVGKYRPDMIYNTSLDPAYSVLNSRGTSRADIIKGAINNSDYETLAFMPATLWSDPDFQTALRDKYNRRPVGVDQARFKTAILDEIAKSPDRAAKTATAIAIMP